MKRAELYERLERLLEDEHCCGCDQNTCDVSVAFRLGYTRWAMYLFDGSGAASEEFSRLYAELGLKPYAKGGVLEEERRAMCREENHQCEHCGAYIWLPSECDYYCDSCGKDCVKPEDGE